MYRHWFPKLRRAANCVLFKNYCHLFKLFLLFVQNIYITSYPLTSLIEGSHSYTFHLRLCFGSSTSQTVEGILRVRAPGKILWSAPAWEREPWAQRFEWSRKSYDSSCRMSVWSHFLLLDQMKMWLFQVDNTTIQMVEWHLKVIFCLLKCPKFDFGEVEKAMYQGVEMTFLTHIRPLDHPKIRLGWGRKGIFQGLAWHSQITFVLWTSRKCNLIKS